MKLRTLTVIAALLGASALASQASATAVGGNLIVNGDFETGDFTGWTTSDQPGGSGSWFVINNGGAGPESGSGSPFNPGGGDFIAMTDQGGPGSHTLSQTFFLSSSAATLDFDTFENDQSGAGPLGTGLDFTNGANQHVEISIDKVNAPDPLIFAGEFSDSWGHQHINLGPFLSGPGLYTLSFSEVDNQLFNNFGIDNVSVIGGGGGVPEPAEWALMLVGFAGLGAMLRSRRQAAAA